MSVTHLCDFCGRGQEVLRYTLTRKEQDEQGIKHSTSRGGIDLCLNDWQRVGQPRMKAMSAGWNLHGEGVCDRCQSTDEVVRYSLKKSVRDGDVVRDIAGGGINLCAECWQATAKPRMRAFNLARQHRALVERSQYTTGGVRRAVRPSQP